MEGPSSENPAILEIKSSGDIKIPVDQPLNQREKEHKEEEDYFEKDDDSNQKIENEPMLIERNNEDVKKTLEERKHIESLQEKIQEKKRQNEEEEKKTGFGFGVKKKNVFGEKHGFTMTFALSPQIELSSTEEQDKNDDHIKRSVSVFESGEENKERGENITKKIKF